MKYIVIKESIYNLTQANLIVVNGCNITIGFISGTEAQLRFDSHEIASKVIVGIQNFLSGSDQLIKIE